MKNLNVPLPGREYNIVIESGLLDQVGRYCRTACPRARRFVIVTDSNVGPLYGERVKNSFSERFPVRLVTLPAGEKTKSVEWLSFLWEAFMDFGLTRTDAVIALGGGVVGDLTGFAAASILRGVDFIQVPTTLLAQVDSSVGGKVAIDLEHGKNLAGAFWQPRAVLMDPDCLKTLSDRFFADGMAEVLKYGCIWDADFFQRLLDCGNRVGIMAQIEEVLYTCCSIKAQVVLEDEQDHGLRMILNFGHTLGHAYELAYHYETYTHGQAVAAGMCRAAEIGVTLGVTDPAVPEQIVRAVRQFGLPDWIDCSMEDYRRAVGLDKKSTGNQITLILLEEMGKTKPTRLSREQVLELIAPYGKG
ncbi:MAG: 3-dehydroquinate synthase [Oscillospiraceae bacterium]|nr:3-dehydroquinate synthase [Oscillospiraceae bacterium]